MKYRSLSRWKYEVKEDEVTQTSVGGVDFSNGFLSLTEDGVLTIMKGYYWDGPSGPTRDTKNAMRGSLVHDALYQLIRMGTLDISWRASIDLLFHKMLREDGMGWFRAGYFYRAVRMFGGSSAKPRPPEPVKEAP